MSQHIPPFSSPMYLTNPSNSTEYLHPAWRKWFSEMSTTVTNITTTVNIIAGSTTYTTVNTSVSNSFDFADDQYTEDSVFPNLYIQNPYYNSLSAGDGTSLAPSINYGNARTTGLYWANPGIGFSVAGTSRALITSTGLNNTPIGATTPSTGAFTTLSATGTITPNTVQGIVGTTLADLANAGSIGELVQATNLISLTSGVTANVASISLSPGDWDVTACITFLPAAGTVPQTPLAGLSQTSLTFPSTPFYTEFAQTFAATAALGFPVPEQNFNLNSSFTVYLVANINFTVSTMQAQGYIKARRVR